MERAKVDTYLKKLKKNEFAFVGKCWVAGKTLDLTEDQIEEYVLESLHMGDPVDMISFDAVLDDMKIYFENKI